MRFFLSTCLVLLVIPLAADAQDDRGTPIKVLGSYLDEFTYAAGVVDLENVNLNAMAARLAKAGVPAAEVDSFKMLAGPMRDMLIKAGGRYVCFAFNLADGIGDGPLIVIAAGAQGEPKAITQLLGLAGLKTKVNNGTVLAASAPTLERALKRKAAPPADLAAAFAAVDRSPTRLALTMPPVLRRSLEEFMPRLSPALGGGPITPLTRGTRWAAIGLDLSEKLDLVLIVQAKDASPAAALGKLADRFLASARADAEHDNQADLLKGLKAMQPKINGDQLRMTLSAQTLETALLPIIARVRGEASQTHTLKNLARIAVAMHVYRDAHKTFPPQASYDAKGRPLLSWRVHLLPYLDQKALYDQFKLDEPWDSAHNKPLIAKMPAIYRSPFISDAAPGKTTYVVPAGPGLIFDGPKTTKLSQITDGTANTILLVEAAENRAVFWTQPADLIIDRKNLKQGLLIPGASGILTVFADGASHVLPRSITAEKLWLYFDPNDGKVIPKD